MVDLIERIWAGPRRAGKLAAVVATLLVLMSGGVAGAVQVQDLARIKGSESSVLVGMGLVVGLNGTGDGKNMQSAHRQMAAMMQRMGDSMVTAGELGDASNIAVAYLSATVPASGVREGDKIDIKIAAPAAKSLVGGRLVISPMLGPLPNSPIFAYGEGAILVENLESPRTGVVRSGAQMTRDIYSRYMDESGVLTLVMNEANATFPMATTLAELVNDIEAPDSAAIAQAIDAKNVIVQIPRSELANPGPFISRVLEIQIDATLVRSEARVVINRNTGTIVMTENVEMSPVVIAHNNLEITTITPAPVPDQFNPVVEQTGFVGLDPSGRGRARLADLVAAFNQLKVPAEDRVAILEQIHKSGKLHAQLMIED